MPSTPNGAFSRFDFQTATSFSHASLLSRLIARGELLVLSPQQRGAWSAARRTLSLFRFRHRVRSGEIRKRIALRRSIAAILGEGTVLPGEDGGANRPLIRPAFAAFILTASSRERQSHVVGPD
ncbi:MAG: hypothetical protein Q7V17_03965, partial [Afipia sp.]|nr:hypothetical protein [Afipia sp.]